MDNTYQGWHQGYFVNKPEYRDWTKEKKQGYDKIEKLKVRPSPTGNAICTCDSPETAIWVAERLNLAARLESEKIK